MITFTNLDESKKAFKKTFNKDVNGTICVQIYPAEKRIRFAGWDCYNALRELNLSIETTYNYKSVCISNISIISCLFDIIFDKKGFCYDTFRDNRRGLEIKSKENGTIYTEAAVVFRSHSKEYVYKDLECDTIRVIY